MGMCAIYTAVTPPTPEQVAALAKENEATTYGPNRCTLGRKAVAELVKLVAPPSHAKLAETIVDRDLWALLTPAAARGNHWAAVQKIHQDIAIPFPLWPSTVELACLCGAEPAVYLGNNLVLLPPELVADAVKAFDAYEMESDPAAYLNDFLRAAQERKNAVLLHWDYR